MLSVFYLYYGQHAKAYVFHFWILCAFTQNQAPPLFNEWLNKQQRFFFLTVSGDPYTTTETNRNEKLRLSGFQADLQSPYSKKSETEDQKLWGRFRDANYCQRN